MRDPLIFSEGERGGIIHVANIKGGVGKSTLATNLAASLSKRGPTLLIDLDVQGSAGVALGVNETDARFSSWDFFKRRFSSGVPVTKYAEALDVGGLFSKLEEIAIGGVVGTGVVDDCIAEVNPRLHVSPAGEGLFNAPSGQQYGNFLHNLKIVRSRYKYIVIDTPSVWNRLTRFLFVNCDLNLVPVTLDALSTKSVKEYLVHIKRLIAHNPNVRLRIVKNEVNRAGDRVDGASGTINLNRRFLDSLCEQAALHKENGISLLPRSIMFDLEIPESTAIREAQDAGKSVQEYGGDIAAVKAFDILAQNVQLVLNGISRENIAASKLENNVRLACKISAALIVLAAVVLNRPIPEHIPPAPIAPQQVVESASSVAIVHTFARGDNIARLSKYAISVFRGMVPSMQELHDYVLETIEIHNMTRAHGEPKISSPYRIPIGMTLRFYPPRKIVNPLEKRMAPAYRFFMDMVNDAYPYITGDWCERGSGGEEAHYAIDVAAVYGSDILSPVDGVVAWSEDPRGGRTLAILYDNANAMISFAHTEDRYISEGDSVKKGQPVATIGMTGRTSGPHAHISYGIRSVTRFDFSYLGVNYRLTDPKYMFYKMVFDEKHEN